jgi:hypothetical protein
MYLLAEVMLLYAVLINLLSLTKLTKIKFVERVVCKNKNRVQNFRMKTKWITKNLKPATVDGKIILKWI